MGEGATFWEVVIVKRSIPIGLIESRREFYLRLLDFARRYPEVKVSLYIPGSDLTFFTEKEWLSIACDLLDLCESGRLTLMGIMRSFHFLEYLRAIRKGRARNFFSRLTDRE